MKFKEAIMRMLEDGEFPKILNQLKAQGDKRELKRATEYVKFIESEEFGNAPAIVLLTTCKSAAVLQDAIAYMECATGRQEG